MFLSHLTEAEFGRFLPEEKMPVRLRIHLWCCRECRKQLEDDFLVDEIVRVARESDPERLNRIFTDAFLETDLEKSPSGNPFDAVPEPAVKQTPEEQEAIWERIKRNIWG